MSSYWRGISDDVRRTMTDKEYQGLLLDRRRVEALEAENNRLQTSAVENHRLAERVAELEAENTAFLSFVVARINAIIGGDYNDMINDLCRLRDYLEGEAE